MKSNTGITAMYLDPSSGKLIKCGATIQAVEHASVKFGDDHLGTEIARISVGESWNAHCPFCGEKLRGETQPKLLSGMEAHWKETHGISATFAN